MRLKIKIFLGALILSLPFFWGVNVLEKNLGDFLFWHEISQNPQIFTAQISLEQKWQEMKPIRNREIPDLEIEAKSAVSVLINKNKNEERILFEKNRSQELPIASITKLMTAWVVLEHYDLSKEIVISKEAANQYGDVRKLDQGKVFTTKYLLYPLLMESSNGAAFALANDYQQMTEVKFLELMNQEAEKMGLENTFFYNPSGLDPNNSKTEINHSTTDDLIKLVQKLLEKPLIWEILSIPKYYEYGPELTNTNKFLLNNDTDWQTRIVGGKTGYTSKAGGCLLLVINTPRDQGFLISVILGANGRDLRFQEMKKLVDWLKTAYKW